MRLTIDSESSQLLCFLSNRHSRTRWPCPSLSNIAPGVDIDNGLHVQSTIYNGNITTDFDFIVLIPLPYWIFLLSLVQLFAANRMNPVPADSLYTMEPEEKELPTIRIHPTNILVQISNPQSWKMVVLLSRPTGYLLLLVTLGTLLLSIDELVHLGISGWGVGLLPFVPITAAIASTLHFARNHLNPYDFKLGGLYGLRCYNKRLAGSFKSKITLRSYRFGRAWSLWRQSKCTRFCGWRDHIRRKIAHTLHRNKLSTSLY
jgi:hypothetical protein